MQWLIPFCMFSFFDCYSSLTSICFNNNDFNNNVLFFYLF